MPEINLTGAAPLIASLCGTVLLLLIGGLLIFQAFRSKRKVEESATWPITPGRVNSSSVTRQYHHDNDGGGHYSYTPVVQYTYSVMGQSFTSNRISFGIRNSSQGSANATVQRYPSGAPVNVHFDPAKPQDSVLEVTQSKTAFGCQLVGGVVLALIGLGIACFGLYSLASQLLK
jgi:hypothetical protein